MRLNLILLLSLLFGFVAHTQTIKIVEVRGVNLEEDKGPFATQNDEICIVLGEITIADDSISDWSFSSILTLSDSVPSKSLDSLPEISIDSNTLLLIALVEIDGNNSAATISQIVKDELLLYLGYPFTLIKEKIRLKLEDDDLLGFRILNQKILNNTSSPIPFKGMHMFNRYHYELIYTSK